MQKDRKSKLAEAFMARRKKQLACYLASTLGVAVSTSLCLMPGMAFDVPPPTQPKTVYMGAVGVGSAAMNPAATDAIATTSVGNDQASSSEALKRVGIRFVGPENQAKLNASRVANQAISHTPTVIQPPMVIASQGTLANAQSSSESSVAGIRIRIPSDKPTNVSLPVPTTNNTSLPPLLNANQTTANLKMTVGTGVAPLPTITSTTTGLQTTASNLKSVPTIAASSTPAAVSFGTPTTTATAPSLPIAISTPPTIAASGRSQVSNQQSSVTPLQVSSQTSNQATAGSATAAPGFAIPSQTASSFAIPKANTSSVIANVAAKQIDSTPNESPSGKPKTSESFASQPASGSKLQARLQDNSAMTSRAPGIVRIPSMVVSGALHPTAELPQTNALAATRTSNNMNATTDLATAKPLPSPGFIGNGSALELPALPTSQTQMMQSRAPSLESRSLKQPSTTANLSSAPAPTALSINSGFQSLPSTAPQPANLSRVATKVSAESLAQTANRSIELAEKAIGPTAASSTPRLTTATSRANPRYEPSIIPVALLSSAPKETTNIGLGNQSEPTSAIDDQAHTEDSTYKQSPSENQPLASIPGPAAGPATSTINVALRNVQTIRLPGKVSQVEIEDDTVCRIISTEPNTLTIIGASIGESKITVWSTNPTTKQDETQDFKISVRETWGQAAKNTVSIDDVNQSIAALFPGSSIVIKPNSDGSISVQGSATSNESAKQILMLVRKMFLVPVQDRIAIANL